MMSSSPQKFSPMKQSYQNTTATASPSRFPGFSNVREIPLDPQATYAISYVPGMSEHAIESPNTLEEARLKIVALTCELEKINTFNYSLVRENEVLRVQANKSEREKDLETKLAVVLAENEKLNRIIEEVYDVYMSTRNHGGNPEYERQLDLVHEKIQESKKSSAPGNQNNIVELQNTIRQLLNEKEGLSGQLTRKDKELEIMRARVAALEKNLPVDNPQQQISVLIAENEALKRELEAIRLKYGKADSLQLKLSDYENKIRTVLAENEKLNGMLLDKINEVKELKSTREVVNNRFGGEVQKRAGVGVVNQDSHLLVENAQLKQQIDQLQQMSNPADKMKLQQLLEENDRLNHLLRLKLDEIEHLKRNGSNDEKLIAMSIENHRLNEVLNEKNREIEVLRSKIYESQTGLTQINELNTRLTLISRENEKLNAELESLRIRVREDRTQDFQNQINYLNAEKYKLTEALNEKTKEIELLRYKVNEVQINFTQINELNNRLVLISRENEKLVSELETLRIRVREDRSQELQNQINYLNAEKYKLTEALNEKTKEIELLRYKVNEVQINFTQINELNNRLVLISRENEKLVSELETLRIRVREDKSQELQSQITYITSEKYKLEMLLQEKLKEIERFKGFEQQRLYEIEQIRIKIQSEQEIKFQSLRADFESQIHKLLIEKKELEERAVRITIEVDRLQALVRDLKIECEEWKKKYVTLESSRNGNEYELIELRKQFESLKIISVQAKDLQQRFGVERTAYETQILQLTQLVNDLELRVQMLSTENERITGLSVQRLNMIEELKRNNNEEAHKLEVYELRNQLEVLKSHAYDVKQLAVHYQNEKAVDQSRINELTQMNLTLKAEIDNLKVLVEKRKADVESLTLQVILKNEDLRKMCERLNHQSMYSVGIKTESVEVLQSRITELEMSRNEFQKQAERNAIELARKNRELVEKLQETDVLKLKYEEALANYQALNSQLFNKLSVNYHH